MRQQMRATTFFFLFFYIRVIGPGEERKIVLSSEGLVRFGEKIASK